MAEQEIYEGDRAKTAAQAAFSGAADPSRTEYSVDCGWYDTRLDPLTGYFAYIDAGSDLEELVGEILLVTAGTRSIFVYCLGGADLPVPICLTRRAFFDLAPLNKESIDTRVQVIVRSE